MRFTFTGEIRNRGSDTYGLGPEACFQMWKMNGFGPWKKKSLHGTTYLFEHELEELYIYFSSDENNEYHGGSGGLWSEERIDMNEFLKGYKAIQAYKELNSS